MKPWTKFGLANGFAGFLIGLYVYFNAIGEGYWAYVIAAPSAAFLTAELLWRLLIKANEPGVGRVVLTGILTGTISHYIAFVLTGIGMNLCYWTTGGCTGSLGDPPAGILVLLPAAFGFSFFSLLFLGWITVPVSVAIGLLLRKRAKMT